ncbi:MAG: RNA-binding S4 domain-containing protein [Solirubrobacterales bacterium]
MSSEIPIAGEMIRLGQLLKLAGVVHSGSEAKALLAAGRVLVNGAPEARRGRQLHPGDTVRAGPHDLRVTTAS